MKFRLVEDIFVDNNRVPEYQRMWDVTNIEKELDELLDGRDDVSVFIDTCKYGYSLTVTNKSADTIYWESAIMKDEHLPEHVKEVILRNIPEKGVDEDLGETLEKKSYSYKGPVFRFGKWYDNVDLVTSAVSKKQAINNIKAQIKRKNDLEMNASLDLDDTKIQELNTKNSPTQKDDQNNADGIQLSMNI